LQSVERLVLQTGAKVVRRKNNGSQKDR